MSNLNQREIDALIESLSDRGEIAGVASGVGAATERRPSSRFRRHYRVYDFRRPEKLSKDQVRVLRSHFGRFTRALTNYLATLTRTSVDTTLVEVDQTAYGEVFKNQGEPTLLCAFSLGTEIQGLLKVNLSQLYAILDRLMGGPGSPTLLARPLTDFERGVMGEVCEKVLAFHGQAVDLPGDVKVDMIDTDERVMPRSLAADEFMVRGLYDLRLGATSGHLSIYTPLSALGRLLSGGSRTKQSNGQGNRARTLPPAMTSLPLPVTVELGSARLTAAHLTSLAPGQVICLEQDQSCAVKVRVGGVARFRARPGTIAGKMAVVIEGPWKEKL